MNVMMWRSDCLMKTKLTPQQKKLHSYAKDGRNGVAESRSIANKAITKRKAKANRALRRAGHQSLAKGDEVVECSGRKSFKKIPDLPLAEYVSMRLAQRGRTKNLDLINRGKKCATNRKSACGGHLQ